MSQTPRLRFAPSPTGPLHIGGARTALYNWAAARALGGQFLLRIEDTDVARSTKTSLDNILEALSWLGLHWDEGPGRGGEHGPYFQSERLALYARHGEELVRRGAAYPCFCTPEEVDAMRAAQEARGERTMYDRRCRNLSEAERQARLVAMPRPSLRFALPLDRVVRVHDLCKGEVEVNTAELDDWVMLRPDGMPLYNFACVVDDHAMRITHVVRGEEHFLNGIKQILCFEAMGWPAPAYAHIPLILGKDGRKLSKREAAVAVLEYRDRGFPADAVFNYIALLGWSYSGDQDVFSRDEMVARFRIEDIGKAGSKFDEEKFLWMSGDYIRRMPLERMLEEAAPHLIRGGIPGGALHSHRDWLRNVFACLQERVRVYSELPDKMRFLFQDGIALDEAARRNLDKEPDARAWLRAYAEHLQQVALPPSYPGPRGGCDTAVRLPVSKYEPHAAPKGLPCATPVDLEHDARAFAERLGVKFGAFVHPVRAALTGTTAGFGLFDTLFLLGREQALARLRAAAG